MRRFMRSNPPIPSSPTSNLSGMPSASKEATGEQIRAAQEENANLTEQLSELNKMYLRLEQLLVDSKLQAATLDMEADQLTVELNRKNEMLNSFSVKCTQLEVQVQSLTTDKT